MANVDLDAEREADLRVLDEQIVKIRNRLAVADDDEAGPLQDRLLRFFQRRARMLGLDASGRASGAPGVGARGSRVDGSIAGATGRVMALVPKKP